MKWRAMLELIGPDGTMVIHEVGGRATVAEYVPRMIGLTLEEGKASACGGIKAKAAAAGRIIVRVPKPCG